MAQYIKNILQHPITLLLDDTTTVTLTAGESREYHLIVPEGKSIKIDEYVKRGHITVVTISDWTGPWTISWDLPNYSGLNALELNSLTTLTVSIENQPPARYTPTYEWLLDSTSFAWEPLTPVSTIKEAVVKKLIASSINTVITIQCSVTLNGETKVLSYIDPR